MKIQCSCGVKYSFDLTPAMAQTPVQFVCPNCGLDASEIVNQLIRQEFSAEPQTASLTGREVAPPPPASARPPVLRVGVTASTGTPGMANAPVLAAAGKAVPVPVAAESALVVNAGAQGAAAPEPCLKHAGYFAAERCVVCRKPICPKCMELFGYVCSAFCKGRAEAQHMSVPVYERQKSVAEARRWRRTGLIAGAIAVVLAGVVGFWVWYAWFGSVPKPVFAIRYVEAGYPGQLKLCPQNQIVSLRGGVLARHDVNTKKEVWSGTLVDKQRIADDAAVALERMKEAREKAIANGADADAFKLPLVPELADSMERGAAAALRLHVRGENVWVAFSDKLVRFDWQSGRPEREIPLPESLRQTIPHEGELLLISENNVGQLVVSHIDLASGESRSEEITAPPALAARVAPKSGVSPARSGGASMVRAPKQAALSDQAGAKPLDPAATAAKVQGLSTPSRLALPAVLAANANQQRLAAELRDQPQAFPRGAAGVSPVERPELIPTAAGVVHFSMRLLEAKTVQREAMKAPPQKSALDGAVTASATLDVANEILNDIQRDRGGGVVLEDASRYQATLHRLGTSAESDWTGEVVGSPELFPLQTVNVLVAGKTALVFDQTNKKLWEAKLNYNVASGLGSGFTADPPPFGQGPCVEKGEILYLFDQGVLTSFDLASGNVRWRLPTVGVAGLQFDDRGMIYVNTTTASPEKIKYSRQIDVSDKTRQLVLKVDPKTGKTLWHAEAEGLVSCVSGQFVYTTESHDGEDEDSPLFSGIKTGLEIPAHIRIKRLDAGNGKVLWEHYQKRAPLDVQFNHNSIYLLFKKEIQVLKFVSL